MRQSTPELPSKSLHPRGSGLALAISLAIAFTLLGSLRMAGDSTGILNGHLVLRSVLKDDIWKTQLATNILLLVLAHLALCIVLGFICWLLARLSEVAWPEARLSRGKWVAIWFIGASAWILIANAALYPWSALGEPYAALVAASWFGVDAFRFATALAGLAVAITLGMALWRVVQRGARIPKRMAVTISLALLILAGSFAIASLPTQQVARANSAQPNIVLIGIDSLRNDAILGAWGEVLTPSIDSFIEPAAVFTDAITPLARTFPSWVATLSGKHPHTTGAIINLLPQDAIKTGKTLPQTLRERGYHTAYATDEVRFSNIDTSFGFDQVIAPPMGASDFLLGSLNDTPLSNLVINTRLGKWLFPNSHANRGAAVTYDPDTFVRRFAGELETGTPSFVAVHLTLPHWPYYWAKAPSRSDNTAEEARNLYTTAVRQADKQFAGIVEVLRARGILDNAVVVVMSDHGEALGKPNDNPYKTDGSALRGAVRDGHGTSVLSPHQYRVVLALRAFGPAARLLRTGSRIDVPVSLIDMKPTLLELAGIASGEPVDGASLVPLLDATSSAAAAFRDRIRFTESEFNPRGFQPGKTITSSALEAASTFYEVDPDTDRIYVKRDRIEYLLRERQYAALLGNRLLAAIPNGTQSGFDLVVVNLETNIYRKLEDATVPIEEEDEARLLVALSERFGIALAGASIAGSVSPEPARN